MMHTKGFSVVEVIISAAIMLGVSLAITNTLTRYVAIANGNTNSVKAAYLLDEGVEAVKLMRDMSWSQKITPLASGTAYHIAWNGSMWATTSSSSLIDATFDRTVTVTPVYRDTNSDIASSGTVDAGTKKVVVDVVWNGSNGTTTKTISTYITNLFEN